MTSRDSTSYRLLFFYSLSSSTASSILNIKKTYSQALGLRSTLARQGKLSWSFA